MIGREGDVLKLSEQITSSRLVSIVGSGGIGKTTVAIAVAHHLGETFHGAVLFVDFGMLSDPNLVAPGVASMVGLAVGSNDIRPSLMAYLRDKQILLILEHLRTSHRRRRNARGKHHRGGAAGPYPGDQPRGAAHRRRAHLQTGCPWLST